MDQQGTLEQRQKDWKETKVFGLNLKITRMQAVLQEFWALCRIKSGEGQPGPTVVFDWKRSGTDVPGPSWLHGRCDAAPELPRKLEVPGREALGVVSGTTP